MAYINHKDLDVHWEKWEKTNCHDSWIEISNMVYAICAGVASHFHPKSSEENDDNIHDAYVAIMQKIRDGKIVDEKRGKIFNLLTTSIFRHLYSKMNRNKKNKDCIMKYTNITMQRHGINSINYNDVNYGNTIE